MRSLGFAKSNSTQVIRFFVGPPPLNLSLPISQECENRAAVVVAIGHIQQLVRVTFHEHRAGASLERDPHCVAMPKYERMLTPSFPYQGHIPTPHLHPANPNHCKVALEADSFSKSVIADFAKLGCDIEHRQKLAIEMPKPVWLLPTPIFGLFERWHPVFMTMKRVWDGPRKAR